MKIQIFCFSLLIITAGIVYAGAERPGAPQATERDFTKLEEHSDEVLKNDASFLSDADLSRFQKVSRRFRAIGQTEFETRASWLWKHGEIIPTLPFHAHDGNVEAVFITNKGNIVSVGDDHRIYVWQWDGTTYQNKPPMTDDVAVRVLEEEFSPAKNILVLGHVNNIVNIWNVQEGKKISQFNIGTGWPGSNISLSPDGTILAVRIGGHPTGIVDLWDITTVKPWKITTIPIRGINKPIFSPDGKTLAALNVNGEYVSVWNIKTGAPAGKFKFTVGPLGGFGQLSFGPDGRLKYYNVYVNKINAWDVQMNRQIPSSEYVDYDFGIRLVLSHNGYILATFSNSKNAIVLWHTQSIKIIQEINSPCEVTAGAFSPDDKMIAIGCSNGDIVTWKAKLPEKKEAPRKK